jgi:hypothetical protein
VNRQRYAPEAIYRPVFFAALVRKMFASRVVAS